MKVYIFPGVSGKNCVQSVKCTTSQYVWQTYWPCEGRKCIRGYCKRTSASFICLDRKYHRKSDISWLFPKTIKAATFICNARNLTPWSRVLPKKLTGSQFVKDLPVF